MPKQTLVFAALLIALGLGAFALSGSRTALLPTYFGGALAVLAGLALAWAGARRHGGGREHEGDDPAERKVVIAENATPITGRVSWSKDAGWSVEPR